VKHLVCRSSSRSSARADEGLLGASALLLLSLEVCLQRRDPRLDLLHGFHCRLFSGGVRERERERVRERERERDIVRAHARERER